MGRAIHRVVEQHESWSASRLARDDRGQAHVAIDEARLDVAPRYDQSSTVLTSQLPFKTWHEGSEKPTIADAICNRLVHNAHVVTLRGGSMRKKNAIAPEVNQSGT